MHFSTSDMSTSVLYASLLSLGLALVFAFTSAALTLSRYLEKGGSYLFFWGIGMFFLGLAVFAEILLHFFFAPTLLRLWLLGFVLLSFLWLGQGTVLWFFPRSRLLRISSSVVMIFSFTSAVVVNSLSGTNFPHAQDTVTQLYQKTLSGFAWFSLFAQVLNWYGAILLLAGTLLTIDNFLKSQKSYPQMFALLLIHAGGFLLGILLFVKTNISPMLYSVFLPMLSFFLLSGLLLLPRASTLDEQRAGAEIKNSDRQGGI